MVNLIAPAFVILLHLAVSPAAHAYTGVFVSSCNNTDGNYTTNSPYEKNLDSLITKITTTDTDNGFYNFTAGHSPDKASLISLCFNNVNVTTCHTCQKFVTDSLKESCPAQKTAIAWSDDCMVQYSKRSILGVLSESPFYYMLNQQKVSNDIVEKYSGAVKALLEGLPGNASWIKFASAQNEFSSSVTLYAMAQCTPDLSQKECSKCVSDANSIILTCEGCKGAKGARALLPSCIVRFEEYKFYLSSDAPIPSQSPSPSPSFTIVPSESPSPGAGPSMSPGLAPDMTVGLSPSREPDSTPSSSLTPNHDDTVNTKVGAPSPSSVGNAAAAVKNRIGSTSFIIWAIAVFGACFSPLL